MPYKQKSDSYLMTLTKAQIIEELRVAEHNFAATEEALNNSIAAGKAIYEESQKAKELLTEAVNALNNFSCTVDCKTCVNVGLSNCDDFCYKWNRTDEALALINKRRKYSGVNLKIK